MKKFICLLMLSSSLLVAVSPLVMANTPKEKSHQVQVERININTASIEQLITLPGVGKKKAAAIISHRQKIGKFKSVQELTDVKGIGEKMLLKLKTQLKVS